MPLLNASATILPVQNLLGHKRLDTTLGCARLYDGSFSDIYHQAVSGIEKRLDLPEDRLLQPASIGQLLAAVDAIRQGTLNSSQTDLVQRLRAGLLSLTERENHIDDGKVLAQIE